MKKYRRQTAQESATVEPASLAGSSRFHRRSWGSDNTFTERKHKDTKQMGDVTPRCDSSALGDERVGRGLSAAVDG